MADYELEKLIRSKGQILNDNECDVDYLGRSVYAEALSHKIEEVSTPITIGIFAKWGSGKSFLLNHVKDILSKKQRQNRIRKENPFYQARSFICRSVLRGIGLLVFVTLIVVASLCAASPKMFVPMPTAYNDTNNTISPLPFNTTDRSLANEQLVLQHRKLLRFIFIAVLFFCLTFVCFLACGNRTLLSSQFFANLRLISYAAFTELPVKYHQSSIVQGTNGLFNKTKGNNIKQQKTGEDCKKRFIFVNFSAWQYAGSDTLWAGIITNLTKAIEEEFGSMTSRLFRMLSVSAVTRNITKKETRIFAKFHQSNQHVDNNNTNKAGDNNPTNQNNSSPNTVGESSPDKRGNSISNNLGDNRLSNLGDSSHSNRDDSSLNNQEEGIKKIMKSYGVVRSCKPYSQAETNNKRKKSEERKKKNKKENKEDDENKNKNWWVVQFSTPPEAQQAKESLSLRGIEADYNYPESSSSHNNDNKSTRHTTGALHFLKYPKTTCYIPNFFLWILILVLAVALPFVTYCVVSEAALDVFRTGRVVPLIAQIFAWLPASVASSFVIFKLIWAMFHSQRNRIMSALDGAKGAMSEQMGIMDKVKKEVDCITNLIKCAEFTHNKQYKVIIFIDDLDRVALDKMKSVFEAVNILLSDRSSPFVCLIAVDSQAAVKCIEENLGSALLGSGVSGHEYLKKIINLPFHLPEISDDTKQSYFEGLIDLADEASKKLRRRSSQNPREDGSSDDVDGPMDSNAAEQPTTMDASRVDASMNEDVPDAVATTNNNSQDSDEVCMSSPADDAKAIETEEDFLYECRLFMCDDPLIHRFLHGNPRNIKRIFNVISMTSWLIHCYHQQYERAEHLWSFATSRSTSVSTQDGSTPVKRNKKLAKDLVIWTLLTDQWPYRMSYLLQVIEDMDKKSRKDQKEDISLLHIYENFVQSEITTLQSEKRENNLTSLDNHLEMFHCFLKELDESPRRINKSRAKELKKITVNLDRCIRQAVVKQREEAQHYMNCKSEPKLSMESSKTTKFHETSGEKACPNKSGPSKNDKCSVEPAGALLDGMQSR